jgi:hypothetical protein
VISPIDTCRDCRRGHQKDTDSEVLPGYKDRNQEEQRCNGVKMSRLRSISVSLITALSVLAQSRAGQAPQKQQTHSVAGTVIQVLPPSRATGLQILLSADGKQYQFAYSGDMADDQGRHWEGELQKSHPGDHIVVIYSGVLPPPAGGVVYGLATGVQLRAPSGGANPPNQPGPGRQGTVAEPPADCSKVPLAEMALVLGGRPVRTTEPFCEFSGPAGAIDFATDVGPTAQQGFKDARWMHTTITRGTIRDEPSVAPQAFSFVEANNDRLVSGFCVLKGNTLFMVEMTEKRTPNSSGQLDKLRPIARGAAGRM